MRVESLIALLQKLPQKSELVFVQEGGAELHSCRARVQKTVDVCDWNGDTDRAMAPEVSVGKNMAYLELE